MNPSKPMELRNLLNMESQELQNMSNAAQPEGMQQNADISKNANTTSQATGSPVQPYANPLGVGPQSGNPSMTPNTIYNGNPPPPISSLVSPPLSTAKPVGVAPSSPMNIATPPNPSSPVGFMQFPNGPVPAPQPQPAKSPMQVDPTPANVTQPAVLPAPVPQQAPATPTTPLSVAQTTTQTPPLQIQIPAAQSQTAQQTPKPTTPTSNGSQTPTGEREIRSMRPVQGVSAALKTIERFRSGQIKNEVAVREGGSWLLTDFPEQPFIVTPDVYETPATTWVNTWKPELLEKMYSELYIRDLKNSRDIKRRISEFRYHVDNLPSEDEIWLAKELPIMHQLSCMNSKKNKNCMGCSPFWKCVQTIQEEIRPWGTTDLLHYEPSHSETFLGLVAMNGSYVPYQKEMLACDLVNTMFYSDDPNAQAIWGFISPAEIYKLTEEDGLGIQFYDSKTFVDPNFLEKKVKVLYALQRPGDTIIVPAGWIYGVVYMGRGLTFSASWDCMRLKHINDARRALEFNRSLGVYKPVNVSSLVISAAYQKLDEIDCVDTQTEKRAIMEFLLKILPVLKTIVLEEILGEHINLSGSVVLSYDSVVEKFKKNARNKLPSNMTQELAQIRTAPFLSMEQDIIEDDEDLQYSCYFCKCILFNSRRSCTSCKGYDLCDHCFTSMGRLHPHKLKKFRKTTLQSLVELSDNVTAVFADHRDEPPPPPPKKEVEVREVRREPIREVSPPVVKEPREVRALTQANNDAKLNVEPGGKRRKREAAAKPPIKEEQSPPRDENYDEEVIDCICGNNKDLGFMISCEKCLAWLHGKCVGISKRNEPDEYYCPRCVKKYSYLAAKVNGRGGSPERKRDKLA